MFRGNGSRFSQKYLPSCWWNWSNRKILKNELKLNCNVIVNYVQLRQRQMHSLLLFMDVIGCIKLYAEYCTFVKCYQNKCEFLQVINA